MIVRVTTLGAVDGNAVSAAHAVVKYLDGRAAAPGGITPHRCPSCRRPTPPPSSATTPTLRRAGPLARRGITGMRLGDEVDPREFRRVLLGQHPSLVSSRWGRRGSPYGPKGAGRERAAAAARGEPDELFTVSEAAGSWE